MGRRTSGRGGGGTASVLKERANMSFMLVVMFFAVFGLIVLTEIFLIDERHGIGAGGAALGARGRAAHHRLAAAPDRPDYEEIGPEDYAGLKGNLEDHLGMLVRGEESQHGYGGGGGGAGLGMGMGLGMGGASAAAALPMDPRGLPSLPANLEARLPRLDPALRASHAEWLPVTNTRFKFFVYSAYYDERVSSTGLSSSTSTSHRGGPNTGVVRVIGATKTRGPERVWCRLWYPVEGAENVTTSVTVSAKVKVIRENWNLKYSACFVICPLPRDAPADSADRDRVPKEVSIVARLRVPPTNLIQVRNRPSQRPKERRPLAVCVKPLHYDYNRVLQLIEFIELHTILGASHVTLYNDTLGPEAGCALRYYESRGRVTLLPWHRLDMISQREIRTEGLFAALNDCLYRSMYSYEYLALLDLDEFIVPRHEDTILDLIRWMGTRVNTKTAGAYSFQNAFFYLQWPDDPYVRTSRRATEAGLVTLRKTRRRSKLHPHKQRSKYVCRPRDVVETGNHFVWEFVPGHTTVNVPADAAILHHYRVCEFGGDDCVKTASTVDRTAYKYLDKLADRVEATWQQLAKICPGLPELQQPPATMPQQQEQSSESTGVVR
uniref:Glycosyltransferase family 92 protein n=1 Tax=Trichogramma kaykai TaxID=54128 RepID=A0ABD2XMA2_9HYME